MLPSVTYPWQRRWLPITPAADALEPPYQPDSTGYVNLERWRPKLGTELAGFSLDDLSEQHRCVVLLGEPGIGKSQEWKTQEVRLAGLAGHCFLNLGDIDSEEVLRQEIHEAAAAVAQESDEAVFTLWLDSLDEGLLHVSTLQSALLRVLRRLPLPLERLCLRIMCRNAVWPVAFSEDLTKLLHLSNSAADAALLTLLLSPLSRAQVHEAAELEGFDAERFLATVADADAQPLASRPVTLGLLVRLYRKHQPTFGLTETAGRAGIYERGCLELCERPDRDRPEAHRPDAQMRLLLAGYVAMLTVLTNRRLIFAEPAPDLLGPTELDVYALGGGNTASWQGMQATITSPALRDLFRNTGLFTDLGGGCLVWAHQSYAEFLAAWYLNLSELPVGSLRPLFRSTADPAGGIVPALHETAAWLADMQPAFWEEMLALDPVALLQSDLRRLSLARRAQVVHRLIQWINHLAHPPYQSHSFLEHLAHPGLAAQLTPLLTNQEAASAVNRFAVDLAKTAKVEELQPLLVAQALDDALPLKVRNRALYILEDIAGPAACSQLRPLRLLIPHNDESDELRGHLLRLLWPAHLTVDELLPLLSRRKNRNLFGVYHQFLDDLDRGNVVLTRVTLLAALRWVTQHTTYWRESEETFWRQIAAYLQAQAWDYFEDPEIAAALVEAIIAADADCQPFNVSGTHEQRLAVLTCLLHHPQRPEHLPFADSFLHPNGTPALLYAEDWPDVYVLLNQKLDASARAWLAEILKQLLSILLNRGDAAYTARYEELHRAAKRFPSVKNAFAPWCTPTNLDDERTQRNLLSRKRNQRQVRKQARQRRCRRNITLHYVAQNRLHIRRILAKGTTANYTHWSALAQRIATVKIKGGYTTHHDVTASSRWHHLSPAQQEQATDVAQAVLAQYPILPSDWFTPGYTLTDGADLLHSALLLCQHQRPAYLATLPAAFWESWAACLVEYRIYNEDLNIVGLLRLAGAAVPGIIDDAVFQLATHHANRRETGMAGFTKLYRALPGAGFPDRLLQAIKAGEWHEEFSGGLLVEMLKVAYQPAHIYAEDLLERPTSGPAGICPRPHLAVEAYRWLLFDRDRQSSNSWPHWVRLSTQPDVALMAINASIYHPSPHELRHLNLLEETQLETLLLWLTYTYRLAPDDVDDWDDRRPNGRVAALRTAVAVELATRGTSQAWQMLQQLSDYLGHPYWLRFRLDQVRENLRRNAWGPLPPDALATLSRDATRRWVRSAADLQELLLESLDRFQTDLQGEPTTAQVLWVPLRASSHRSRKVGYEVRDENFLSDVLRQHFRQDLQRANILVKREVEIRPSLGRGTGQRTDIFVEAFTRGINQEKIDVVTVVIEVKLSKNNETETAINDQLVSYLADQKYKHGIFLVGWHYGQYDPKPPRKKDLTELSATIAQQAAVLVDSYTIQARVLDIRLPGDSAR